MAECNSNIILNGPENPNFLASNYFQFKINRLPNFTYFVQSASIPGLSTKYISQPSTLGTFPKIPAGSYSFDILEISFMVSANMKNWIEIYNWMKGVGNLKDDLTQLNYKNFNDTGVFSDGDLFIMNSSYSPISRISFKYMFPISLGALNFSSQNTSTDPVSTTVQFAYSYYELFSIGSTGATGS